MKPFTVKGWITSYDRDHGDGTIAYAEGTRKVGFHVSQCDSTVQGCLASRGLPLPVVFKAGFYGTIKNVTHAVDVQMRKAHPLEQWPTIS